MSELKSIAKTSSVAYEDRLSGDLELTMSEGTRFFSGDSDVHKALRRIACRLDELGIPYAVANGMALGSHGFRRFTDDVDILVTRDSLKRIHDALDGRGYVRPFAKSKNLRDVDSRVKIEFLLAGDYPGDGKPKAVQFPDPENASVVIDGISFLSVEALVELKLASGMSGVDRLKDLADVQELIKSLALPESFADRLNEYVRPKFRDLYRSVRATSRRFLRYWSPQSPSLAGFTLDEAIAAGLTFEPEGDPSSATGRLVTYDLDLAKRFGLEDESEFLHDGE